MKYVRQHWSNVRQQIDEDEDEVKMKVSAKRSEASGATEQQSRNKQKRCVQSAPRKERKSFSQLF